MLQTYLDDQEWDLSAFVDLILAQTTVGSVVKIEDDEDEGLFALVTALNLYRYRVKDFLLHKCRGPRKMRFTGLNQISVKKVIVV